MEIFKSKAVANRAGAVHYFGKVCAKHPEIGGKRSARNGNCYWCNRDKMRVRRAADPETARAASRAAYLKYRDKYLAKSRIRGRLRRTGVDEETYQALLKIQGGKCALCFRLLSGRNCHTDHCHEKNHPRGLLCSTCNQAEGLIRRTGFGAEEFGRRLATYLASPPASELKK